MVTHSACPARIGLCSRLMCCRQRGRASIGMDSRTSSPMLAAALTAGCTASGREVWNLGLCLRRAVPGSIRRLAAAGGFDGSAATTHRRQRHQLSSPGQTSREVQQAIEARVPAREAGTRHETPGGRWGLPLAAGPQTTTPTCWLTTATALWRAAGERTVCTGLQNIVPRFSALGRPPLAR